VLCVLDRFICIVIFDGIDQVAVLAYHTKLNDIISELNPLQSFIVIHINLLKKVNQIAYHGHRVFSLGEMFSHNFDKGFEIESLFFLPMAEAVIVILDLL
jgi:hypothetical protein